MSISKSIILNSDSYKYSQFNQYPENTEYVYSYVESRGGIWDATVMFGLQAFIKEYLTDPITQKDIDDAELIITAHGEPFNREGWQYILDNLGGKLPVVIRAVPEGTVVPIRNVLATIENTDPRCFWLTSFLETALLRAIWYPSTVATNSYESKKIILNALEKTGDPSTIDFKLHDFGARGVSSLESSAIGGAAHLVNFMGTDNISGLIFAREYYDSGIAGFSIPAMEHSTVTSWGKENEVNSYRNMVKQNAKQGGLFGCVSDSYDIFEACKLWGTVLKQEVLDSGATLVVRPDSGNPADVVVKCLYILEKYFGSTTNAKGYRVLNPAVRILQGDGIDHASIRSILFCMEMAGFSADNIAFGQGGALLQMVNRDTMQWAMKCSAIGISRQVGWDADIEVVWHDVYKDPITDSGKRSKRGRVTLWKSGSEFESSVNQPTRWTDNGMAWTNALQEVFCNGELMNEISFEEIRANVRK
jgi:nicotinamide phosphoribosyltransferase